MDCPRGAGEGRFRKGEHGQPCWALSMERAFDKVVDTHATVTRRKPVLWARPPADVGLEAEEAPVLLHLLSTRCCHCGMSLAGVGGEVQRRALTV